jgi:TRAP-type C4-dicarboxylate transport system permease large subunit
VKLGDQHDVLDQLAKRIAYSILLAVGLLSTALLYSFNEAPEAAAVAGAVTLPVGILLYRSLREKKGVRARPQFTRQEMRRRREE